MSQAIYLVQVMSGLCRSKTTPGDGCLTAFTRPDLARQWAKSHYPISLNPFVNAHPHRRSQSEETKSLLFHLRSDSDPRSIGSETRVVFLRKLEVLVQSLCLRLPTEEDIHFEPHFAAMVQSWNWSAEEIKNNHVDKMWHGWWESQHSLMTDEQKTAIWQFLVPEPYDFIVLSLE